MELAPPVLPPELIPVRAAAQQYATAKIKQFAHAFARHLNLALNPEQVDSYMNQTLTSLAAQDLQHTRALRLVLRHDCQSTGCGENGCLLCAANPSRLCKRNIKAKYLIDDHLKAKCGAPLRVELVDETNACVAEGLPHGVQLQVHVMNGERYKEICPENTLLSHSQLRSCIISHHPRALLRREGGTDDPVPCFLQLERGQAVLSDLQVTTSSEALLAGKAPTFRLLIWAVDANLEPVPNVTYVVSEYFVVATKRVKHAIKSDIPSVSDHVSKLMHIGKATVDKLQNLRKAAAEEGFDITIPDDLNSVLTVGLFQRLVEQAEHSSDLKNKVRHLLKLSPEKWEEVCSHCQSAVQPDFRPRAWFKPSIKIGLLFPCKNGAVSMDTPSALIKMGDPHKGEDDQIIPLAQLDVQLFNMIPALKQQAIQSWYLQSHPGWAIYTKSEGPGPAGLPSTAGPGPGQLMGNALGLHHPGGHSQGQVQMTGPAGHQALQGQGFMDHSQGMPISVVTIPHANMAGSRGMHISNSGTQLQLPVAMQTRGGGGGSSGGWSQGLANFQAPQAGGVSGATVMPLGLTNMNAGSGGSLDDGSVLRILPTAALSAGGQQQQQQQQQTGSAPGQGPSAPITPFAANQSNFTGMITHFPNMSAMQQAGHQGQQPQHGGQQQQGGTVIIQQQPGQQQGPSHVPAGGVVQGVGPGMQQQSTMQQDMEQSTQLLQPAGLSMEQGSLSRLLNGFDSHAPGSLDDPSNFQGDGMMASYQQAGSGTAAAAGAGGAGSAGMTIATLPGPGPLQAQAMNGNMTYAMHQQHQQNASQQQDPAFEPQVKRQRLSPQHE